MTAAGGEVLAVTSQAGFVVESLPELPDEVQPVLSSCEFSVFIDESFRSDYRSRMAKILIVDDSADLAASLKLHFETFGHEVQCAVNGRDALTLVLTQTPDVILLDLVMPEMDGPSLLEVIRSYLRIQALPVVVFTGLTDSPMIERIRTLHVNSILQKAKATPDEILHALEEACGRFPAA